HMIDVWIVDEKRLGIFCKWREFITVTARDLFIPLSKILFDQNIPLIKRFPCFVHRAGAKLAVAMAGVEIARDAGIMRCEKAVIDGDLLSFKNLADGEIKH